MSGLAVWAMVAAFLAQTAPASASDEPTVTPTGIEPAGPPASPATPSIVPSTAGDARQTRWYGGPAVAADAITLGLFYATASYADSYQRSHGTGWSGAGAAYGILGAAYLFNGAVVHALNHRSSRAVDSALLRVGGVALGLITTISLIEGAKCFQSHDTANGIFPAGTPSTPAYCYVGVASLFAFPMAAMAIDDAVLARAPVEAAAAPRAAVAPSLVVKPGLALLGLGASF
jgi:hypothetical protein